MFKQQAIRVTRICGMHIRAGAVLFALAVAACAPLLPPRAGVPVEVRPSPNFDERRPNFVILHHTSTVTH